MQEKIKRFPLQDKDIGENSNYLFPEVDDLEFEAYISSGIQELMAQHDVDDESLEKAVSTEAISSAKGRGLVPKTGNWQKPGRWVRPEDADVPVDEDEESRSTQNVYTSTEIRNTVSPIIKVSGFPGIGRGRPKIGQSSQDHKNRALDILANGKAVLFKALDGLGKANPFEKGERTLPKWQIDKLSGISFNWDVVDAKAVDGFTGEVLGSVHVATNHMSLNGMRKKFQRTMGGFEEVLNPETGEMEMRNIPASVLAKEQEDAFMNTIIHELGHCIATEVADDIPYWFWARVENQYDNALDRRSGIKKGESGFPSQYSKRNVAEFFAECFKTYMTNTELLRRVNPEMFKLMETLNSTSPDKMKVRPLNKGEVKGDMKLRERPFFVNQGFQKYVSAMTIAKATKQVLANHTRLLESERRASSIYETEAYKSNVRYYLNEIKKDKKELAKWEDESLLYRRITRGNIIKAIASGFSQEDIQDALEKAKSRKNYLRPTDDEMAELNLWVDEEIKKYPTYGQEFPWTEVSPTISMRKYREMMEERGYKGGIIGKQDDDSTEEDFETYVEIYETPTVIRDGEEVADSITEESVREVDEPLEKATDSNLHRRTDFVIENNGFEPLAGTWKKVFVGGEPKWINERGEYKDSSDFNNVSMKKQEPPGAPPREGLKWKRSTRRWIRPDSNGEIQVGISPTTGEGQELTRFFGANSRKAKKYADTLINPEGREPTEDELDEAIQIYQDLSNVGGVHIEQALADAGFKDFTVKPNFGLFDSEYEPSLFVSGRISPDRKDDFTRLIVDIADTDFDQRSVIIHEPYDDDENVEFGVSDESTGESIEPAASLRFSKTLTAKEFNDLGKRVSEISDGTMGFASHPDGQGIDILNLSVYNTDYEGFLENLGRFLDDKDVERLSGGIEHHDGRAKKTRTIGKQAGPAGFYSEGHYEQRDSYDGLITYDDYRSYHGSKKKEQQGFRKQLTSNHCSQCRSSCNCVLENHTCECFHDCTCPDNSLSNGSVDIIIDEENFNANGVEAGDSIWITVNDPKSPLKGKHILISKRSDGRFFLTGGE